MSKVKAKSFDEELVVVEAEVKAFEAKAAAEETSRAEKNAALYAALAKAFSFHMVWVNDPAYKAFLQDKNINPVARGAKASKFTPTIKALFDPSWDTLKAETDEEKCEKARRQKTISTYSSVLDYAEWSKDGAKDVAAFLKSQGGIEAAKTAWAQVRSLSNSAIERREAAKEARARGIRHGLANLRKGMKTSLPTDIDLKGAVRLAAIYFDEAGVAHFLGLPDFDDSAKSLLDKFLLSNAGANDLRKLLALLSVATVVGSKEANVAIKNGSEFCEIHASQNSDDTRIVAAKLPHQDFLPEGTYWFGAKAIRCLKKLATLGKRGAQFTIAGPSRINGIDAAFEILVTDYQDGIERINAANPEKPWKWDKVISSTTGSGHTEIDGVVTITAISTIEDMARIKPIENWSGKAAVDGAFADWLQATLGISNGDENSRLVKAIRDEGRLTTSFRITERNWTITDGDGDVVSYAFEAAIGDSPFSVDITIGSNDLLAAINTVTSLVGGGAVSISVIDALLRVRAECGDVTAEVFIPSTAQDSQYKEHIKIDQPESIH